VIKNLLDDQHDTDTLDVDFTVADVFVDHGRATADGLDQRAAVRVVQKPVEHLPSRYGSVVQDWSAVTSHYGRVNAVKIEPSVSLSGRGSAWNHWNVGVKDGGNADVYGTPEGETTKPVPGRFSLPGIPESEPPVISVEGDEDEFVESRNDAEMSPVLVEDSQAENESYRGNAGAQRRCRWNAAQADVFSSTSVL
jgi:hypothetical protein